jgi:hypothetical protein
MRCCGLLLHRYGGWQRFQLLLQCLKSIADKHCVSVEAVALRWLIDQGTFPVTAARWSASAGPWATFGHTYGLQAAAAGQGAVTTNSQDASEPPVAEGTPGSSEEAGNVATEQPTDAEQQQQQQGEVVLGGGAAFVPGVDGALFQVASFLDAEDVAALGGLCGAAV